MARIATVNFDLNSVTSDMQFQITTPASHSMVTSPVYVGNYAHRINATGSAAQSVLVVNQGVNSSGKIYFRGSFRMPAYPAALTTIMQVRNAAATVMVALNVNTNGSLRLNNGSSTGIFTSAILNANQYYNIELVVDATTNPGMLELWIDDVIVFRGANSVQGQWAQIRWGVLSNVTFDCYFGQIIANDDTGSFENSYVGKQLTAMLRPNGAGDSNMWVKQSGAAGSNTNYQLVNESPPDDGTTYVRSGTLNDIDLYAFDDLTLPAGAVVKAVEVGGRFQNNTIDAVTAFQFLLEKTSAGTLLASSAIIPNSGGWRTNIPTANLGQRSPSPITAYADPDGSDWSQSTINSLQAGVKLSAANVNRVNITAIWVMVSYRLATPQNSNFLMLM